MNRTQETFFHSQLPLCAKEMIHCLGLLSRCLDNITSGKIQVCNSACAVWVNRSLDGGMGGMREGALSEVGCSHRKAFVSGQTQSKDTGQIKTECKFLNPCGLWT